MEAAISASTNDRSGLLFALGGFVLLSCGDAVAKTMAGQWAPTGVAALRYAFGALGLGVLLLLREGRSAFVYSTTPGSS